MKNIKSPIFIFGIAALFLFFWLSPVFAVEPPSVFEMDDKSDTEILENGDAKVREVLTMSATAFASFRQKYPVLSTFTRIFKPANIPVQIENLDVKLDEAKNQIVAEYTMKGIAVNKGDYWEIDYFAAQEMQKVNLEAQNGNILVFNIAGEVSQGIREVTTIILKLPAKAREIKFDSDAKKVTYKFSGRTAKGDLLFLILAGAFFIVGLLSFFFLKPIKSKAGAEN